MENFFYGDKFHLDMSTLIEDLDLDSFDDENKEIEALPDDWEIVVEETTIEKMFTMTEAFVVNAIVEETDMWEDRFPEESDDIFDKIKNAIKQSIDIEKLNSLLPELYYANGKKTKITKQDLLDYVK